LNYKSLQETSFSFGRDLHNNNPKPVRGKGHYLFMADGRKVFDAASGAAVSCLGHGNSRIKKAALEHMKTGIPYLASSFWDSLPVEELCKELIHGTGYKMGKVYLTGSGSEAMDAAIKLARQYFFLKDNKTRRKNIIAREGSYHGNTIGALSVSGHLARKKPYSDILMKNVYHISSCYPYRQKKEGESNAAFVARKAAELDSKFQELGPETVIGFVVEPVVGAALGCVPAVPGYLKAMRDICHKHGALFIVDEVMCGMGRSGTLHVSLAEGVVPDIQTVGKGLGGGYTPISAVFISPKLLKEFMKGNRQFVHGHTFQSMPLQAVVALEVQRIIREGKLIDNVLKQGKYLEKSLKAELSCHPNVGDIRGVGLFWGIEFVKNKFTKKPFDPKIGIANKISDLAKSSKFNMTVYPGTGTVDGVSGDHIIISPAYTIKKKDAKHIVKVVSAVIHSVFK
jgi:adenosylmethionine-8-amino-7-oxononanoate aminotransferase